MPPALIAMGARVTIAGVRGTRTVNLEDFFYGPYETALEMGEVLTEILVPSPEGNSAGCHMKFTIGSPENKPVGNVSTQMRMEPDTGRVADVRIVMGTVGPVPTLATEAASLLIGERPDDTLIGEVATRASEESDPIDDLRGSVWYKRRIVRVLVERGLTCALQKAKDRHENA
jgi:carbon-monoxide dehydrogenase medium subunit